MSRDVRLWDPDSKKLAKAIMGRPARVALAAWILAGDSEFYQGQAVDGLKAWGAVESAVLQELERFVGWGLLYRQDPTTDDRHVWYVVRPHAVWRMFAAASAAFGLLDEVPAAPADSPTGRRRN